MSGGNGNHGRGVAERRIAGFVERRFGGRAGVEPLAGDASDRTFFRVTIPGLGRLVAIVHPEPFQVEELPYFVQARLFKEMGADVPEIIGSYPGDGILLVQDLGDETLMTALRTATPERRHFLYRQAVQIIARLQAEGRKTLTPDMLAARTALDKSRLLFELRFFSEHYVRGKLGSPLGDAEERRLDEWFERLAESVAALPFTLCHRDYHSRNLMLRGDRLYMVDFQDARMGPYLYDLASLLRDSYVRLPEDLVDEMLGFFLEATGAEGSSPRGLPERFLEEFEWTCLQRNIKAIGTFAYQAVARGNERYLPCIPPTLESIRENLMRRGQSEILDLFQGPLLLV